MGLVLITHDLALLARHARRVAVMYAGEVVEVQTLPELFDRAHHPYTEALLAAIPERSRGARRLPTLAGRVPGHHDRLAGCLLAPRCRYADETCRQTHPELTTLDDASQVRCLKPLASPVTSSDVALSLARESTEPGALATTNAPNAPTASGLPSGASA
jgi:dipeptide transport system ATP-binding protein